MIGIQNLIRAVSQYFFSSSSSFYHTVNILFRNLNTAYHFNDIVPLDDIYCLENYRIIFENINIRQRTSLCSIDNNLLFLASSNLSHVWLNNLKRLGDFSLLSLNVFKIKSCWKLKLTEFTIVYRKFVKRLSSSLFFCFNLVFFFFF